MPFTLAHPAAVLPLPRLTRGRLPLAALVAGSIAPDTAYFLAPPHPWFRESAHTAWRTLTFCVPVGLALLGLAVALRPGLRRLLPDSVRDTLAPLAPIPLRCLPWAAVGVWVGAISHVLWDSFTHRTGWFVRRIAVLHDPFLFGEPLFRYLQHASTLLGLLAIAIFLARQARAQGHALSARLTQRGLFWIGAALLSAAFTAATVRAPWNLALSIDPERPLFLVVTSATRNFAALTLLAAAALSVRRPSA